MVETLTVSGAVPVGTPVPRYRFQLDNHLGTACVECDTSGAVISYEEYHPYGTSAYRAFQSSEVSAKRYRYTGKERDEETGLYYHGARYYAPWLGRWTQADPAGTVDGTNLYAYVRGSPVGFRDPNGQQGQHGAIVSEFKTEPTRITLGFNVGAEVKPQPAEGVEIAEAGEGGPGETKVVGPIESRQAAGPGRAATGLEPISAGRGPILVPEPPEQGLEINIEAIKATIRLHGAVKGGAILERQRKAEAARLSPGEAMAEVHAFGEKGGAPLKLTVEWIAGEAAFSGAIKGIGALRRGVRALREAGKFELERSLGLEGLGASGTASTEATSTAAGAGQSEAAASRVIHASRLGELGAQGGTVVLGHYTRPVFMAGQQVGIQETLPILEEAASRLGGRTLAQLPGRMSVLTPEIEEASRLVFFTSEGMQGLTAAEIEFIQSSKSLLGKTTFVYGGF